MQQTNVETVKLFHGLGLMEHQLIISLRVMILVLVIVYLPVMMKIHGLIMEFIMLILLNGLHILMLIIMEFVPFLNVMVYQDAKLLHMVMYVMEMD